jgi:hypothetical protein
LSNFSKFVGEKFANFFIKRWGVEKKKRKEKPD